MTQVSLFRNFNKKSKAKIVKLMDFGKLGGF